MMMIVSLVRTCDESKAVAAAAADALAVFGGTYVAHSLQSLTAKSWQSTCA